MLNWVAEDRSRHSGVMSSFPSDFGSISSQENFWKKCSETADSLDEATCSMASDLAPSVLDRPESEVRAKYPSADCQTSCWSPDQSHFDKRPQWPYENDESNWRLFLGLTSFHFSFSGEVTFAIHQTSSWNYFLILIIHSSNPSLKCSLDDLLE